MTEYVGRTGAKRNYSYPENPRAAALGLFARNFASGPKVDTNIADVEVNIPWNSIDVPPNAGNTDVPITPRATGVVLISGMVAVANTSGAQCAVLITVKLDGVPIAPPTVMSPTVENGGLVIVPILIEVDIPVGETHAISVSAEGEAVSNVILVGEGSSLNLQEVSVATG